METLKTKKANTTVYKRFAVYRSDNSTSSKWLNAFTICSNISADSWRLPTQRELQLIWVLKRELENIGKSDKFTDVYWSATDSDTPDLSSFDVVFSGSAIAEGDIGIPDDEKPGVTDKGGATSCNNQLEYYKVRCIRELE